MIIRCMVVEYGYGLIWGIIVCLVIVLCVFIGKGFLFVCLGFGILKLW